MFIRRTTALVAFIFAISSCSNAQMSDPDNESVEIISVTSTPEKIADLDVLDAGYPSPELEIQTDLSQPGYPEPEIAVEYTEADLAEPALPLQLEPSEIGATIGGVLIDEDTQQGSPESLIYLGNMKYTETGFPVVSLDRQTAPLAILAPNGAFIFHNIEPGEYALVFFTPDYSFLVEDSEEMTVFFTVEEGDVLDLGTSLVSIP